MIIRALILITIVVGLTLFLRAFYPEQRAIPGIPEPKGLPFIGHLLRLGPSPALTYLKWSQQLNSEVIQIKLGTKRIVLINSFSAATQLIYGNMSANCDRPQPHTFSNIVSATGLTVGTTPYGPSYKRMRKAIGSFLCRTNLSSKQPYIDRELGHSIAGIPTNADICPHDLFKTYSFNVSTSLAYGFRISNMAEIARILDVEQRITRFRAHFATSLADYFPVLQWVLPESKEAAQCRRTREEYLESFISANDKKQDPDCLVARANRGQLQLNSRKELKSICMTMSSAGLDSIPGILALFVGHMSTDYGQAIQARAFEEILEAFPSNPYDVASKGKEIPYISALVAETLRFSGMPLNLPRRTTKPVSYVNEHHDTITIPANTTLVLNIFAANFDPKRYKDPFEFIPDRFLTGPLEHGPQHFSFGAGSRMCAGQGLAKREIYSAILKIIVRYRILPCTDANLQISPHPFDLYKKQSALMFDLPSFSVRFVNRE